MKFCVFRKKKSTNSLIGCECADETLYWLNLYRRRFQTIPWENYIRCYITDTDSLHLCPFRNFETFSPSIAVARFISVTTVLRRRIHNYYTIRSTYVEIHTRYWNDRYIPAAYTYSGCQGAVKPTTKTIRARSCVCLCVYVR